MPSRKATAERNLAPKGLVQRLPKRLRVFQDKPVGPPVPGTHQQSQAGDFEHQEGIDLFDLRQRDLQRQVACWKIRRLKPDKARKELYHPR